MCFSFVFNDAVARSLIWEWLSVESLSEDIVCIRLGTLNISVDIKGKG